jgi:hypothetical protein
MLPVLKKPFETGTILKILQDLRPGHPPTAAGRIALDVALSNGWIEFWYQPKIDLRKKQLVGVEAFARARHPHGGVLMPSAFLPGATEADVIALSEQALAQTLKAALNFTKLGVNLRPAVNIPVNALVKIAVADIVQTYRPQFEKWPGLIIDVTEEQIVTDLALAAEITSNLRHLDVKLAIDDFGRGIPPWSGSRNCRLPNSSSTGRSSPIAAPTRSMRRCASPSSTLRTISAAWPWRLGSRRHRTRSPWSAWAATTVRDSCSVSRCRRSVSSRCCASAPPRRAGSLPPRVAPIPASAQSKSPDARRGRARRPPHSLQS